VKKRIIKFQQINNRRQLYAYGGAMQLSFERSAAVGGGGYRLVNQGAELRRRNSAHCLKSAPRLQCNMPDYANLLAGYWLPSASCLADFIPNFRTAIAAGQKSVNAAQMIAVMHEYASDAPGC
jgi:hypothetical protein